MHDLLATPHLSVVGGLDTEKWLQLWSHSIKDPNDAAVAAAAIATDSAVATFDRRLARRLTVLSIDVWQWSAT